MKIKIGCCGFAVSYKRYMKEFEAVEIQQSFYRRLSEKQIQNWLKTAPSNFEFILKAPQCVTHPPTSPTYRRSDLAKDKIKDCGFFKLNDTTKEEMEYIIKTAKILNANKLVFQTPASFEPSDRNIENMTKFFKYYEKAALFFWEPRGKKWTGEKVKMICKELNINHATDPLLELEHVWGIRYFRLHGNLKNYNHIYSEEELLKIADLCTDGTYVLFNNINMYKDAQKFIKIMEAFYGNN